MFLRSWWIEVTRANQGEYDEDLLFDFTRINPVKNNEELFISVKAEVWCPCCKQVCRIETRKHPLKRSLDDNLVECVRVWQARELFDAKHCPHCGIYFSFPDQARKFLRGELAKQLTEEWLKEQLRKHQFRYQP